MPKVSVIVPLYNKSATIERAIESIISQEYQDFEVIIVDDGSTDGGDRKAERYSSPGRLQIVRQPNAGPGAARNAGVDLSSGEIITFLDADDCWKPTYLAAAVEALDRHPEAGLFIAAYESGNEAVQKNLLSGMHVETGVGSIPSDAGLDDLRDYVGAAQVGCVALRRDVFYKYGGFYSRARALYGEDAYLFLQVLLGEAIYFDTYKHVEFHVEDSELGIAQYGRHPIHPILVAPDPIRRNLPPERQRQVALYLAYFRMRYTQRLSWYGRIRDVFKLRRRFRWPERPAAALRRIERRVILTAAFRAVVPKRGGDPPPPLGW